MQSAGQRPAAQSAGQRPAGPAPDWPREPPLAYNGLAIDRAAGRRGDEAWLRGIARRPGSRLLALWRDKCLVDASGQPVVISMSDAGPLGGALLGAQARVGALATAAAPDGAAGRREPVFLALDGSAGVFAEEAGVPVGEVRYAGSQAWPYPAGLMVGFRARATGEAIRVDEHELAEARWFTRADLAAHRSARPRTHRDSIGSYLLDAWLAQGG